MADPAYIVDGVLTDGEAWVALDSETISGTVTNITFQSTDDGQVGDWSQYMDLVVIAYARDSASTYTDSYFAIQVNNVTTVGLYPSQWLYGDGTSATAFWHDNQYILAGRFPDGNESDADVFGSSVTTLFDINSGKWKTALCQWASDMDGRGTVGMAASTAEVQAAITELDCYFVSGGNIVADSRVDLFGVLPRMVA